MIARIDVIDDAGRVVTMYGEVRYEIQDDGRTLKVWVDQANANEVQAEIRTAFADWMRNRPDAG